MSVDRMRFRSKIAVKQDEIVAPSPGDCRLSVCLHICFRRHSWRRGPESGATRRQVIDFVERGWRRFSGGFLLPSSLAGIVLTGPKVTP